MHVNHVSSTRELLRRCGVVSAVFGKTVNENQNGSRLALGQPDLLVQAQAVVAGKKVFVMEHEGARLERCDFLPALYTRWEEWGLAKWGRGRQIWPVAENLQRGAGCEPA